MVSRGRGRGMRGNSQQSPRTLVRNAQRRDGGHKVVPSLRPPQIVRLPWNSYTFSATYGTSTASEITVTVGNIRQQIVSLMGFTGASGIISLKVNSASAWNTAVGPGFSQPSLQGLFWELSTDSGGSYSTRSEQYDHGTLNVPARVGYVYPLADRKEVHTPLNDSHVVAKFTVPSGNLPNGNVTVRVHVLWNSAASASLRNIADTAPANPDDIDQLN